MNTQLIPVASRPVGSETIPTINARELHAFLGVGKDFSTWMKDRVESFGFTENQDFVVFPEIGEKGGRPSKEYALTLDMAKELSMVERNAKGKQARQYFIDCERQAKQAHLDPMQALNDPATLRNLCITYSEKVLTLEHKVEIMQPKVAALDRLTDADGWFCIRDAAKALKLAQNKFVDWLLVNRWLYRDQKGKLRGRAEKTPTFINHKVTPIPVDGDADRVSMQPMITPAGLTKLASIFNVEVIA